MAKAKFSATESLIRTEISLSETRIERLCKAVGPDMPVAETITGIAIHALEAIADGGIMLTPADVDLMSQSIGQPVLGVEDILPLVESGAGMRGGHHRYWVDFDPVDYPVLAQRAEFQGVSVEEICQRVMDEVRDNGWFFEVNPSTQRVLMTKEDKTELEGLLGKGFSNGTELAVLIKEALGASSPFSDLSV